MVTGDVWKRVKRGMEHKLGIDVPGMGISFLVPVSSIGGKKALQLMLAGQEFEKEEETSLKDTEYELIVVVSDFGYTNLVTDAAREAGAGGGTVIHAKGTGMERAEKFLAFPGIEKEMTFIVTRTEKKKEIMKAINEKQVWKARKINPVSLPGGGTAGLRISETGKDKKMKSMKIMC